MKSLRTRRSLTAAAIAPLLLSIVSLACDAGPGAGEAERPAADASEVFRFIKGLDNIIRLDTRSGETWRTAISGDGTWIRFGAERPDGGLPPRSGRYSVSPAAATAEQPPRGAPVRVRLILVDRDSGRSWLALDTPDAEWALVGEGSASAAATSTDTQGAPPLAAASDAMPSTLGFEGIEFAPPQDMADVSPEQATADVAVLVAMLEKEGIPASMRVWAVGQLARYPGEYAVAPLLDALEGEDPAEVSAAVEGLAQIGDPSTIPHILKLQSHPNADVREAVRIHVTEVR